jgi:hypothetical protein
MLENVRFSVPGILNQKVLAHLASDRFFAACTSSAMPRALAPAAAIASVSSGDTNGPIHRARPPRSARSIGLL